MISNSKKRRLGASACSQFDQTGKTGQFSAHSYLFWLKAEAIPHNRNKGSQSARNRPEVAAFNIGRNLIWVDSLGCETDSRRCHQRSHACDGAAASTLLPCGSRASLARISPWPATKCAQIAGFPTRSFNSLSQPGGGRRRPGITISYYDTSNLIGLGVQASVSGGNSGLRQVATGEAS
jgi:hypothetical protein